MALLDFIVVGIAAGWILGKIRRGKGYGLIGNMAVGAVGSVLGWFIMGFFNVGSTNLLSDIAMAVIGAIVFFLLTGALWGSFKRSAPKEKES